MGQPKQISVGLLQTTSVVLCFMVLLVAGQPPATSKQQHKSWALIDDSSMASEAALEGGERVDRLSSAIGDSSWRPVSQGLSGEQQAEWLRQLSSNGGNPPGQYYPQYISGIVGMDGGPTRNYHALVDEFKQYSSLANPAREGRAFKPKLMSTARGFGKRAYLDQSSHHLTYADLLAASNQNAVNANGKMSGNALRALSWYKETSGANKLSPNDFFYENNNNKNENIDNNNNNNNNNNSSKYSEWINRVLSRWPTMDKYVNDKFADLDGNIA